jgi:hypothetical protein
MPRPCRTSRSAWTPSWSSTIGWKSKRPCSSETDDPPRSKNRRTRWPPS